MITLYSIRCNERTLDVFKLLDTSNGPVLDDKHVATVDKPAGFKNDDAGKAEANKIIKQLYGGIAGKDFSVSIDYNSCPQGERNYPKNPYGGKRKGKTRKGKARKSGTKKGKARKGKTRKNRRKSGRR